MVWYYAEGDRQKGPLSDEEFQDLINNNRINSETLVWKDGMDTWQPLINAREAGLAETSPALPPLPGSSLSTISSSSPSSTTSPAAAGTGSVCAQCGRGPLGAHDGVQLGKLLICRNCDGDLARHYRSAGQPSFSNPGWPSDSTVDSGQGMVSKPGTAALPYAGIVSRAAGKFVDNLVESVVLLVIVALTTDLELLTEAVQQFTIAPQQLLLALRPLMLATLVFRVLYDGVLVGKLGATLGKTALRIRVVSADGGEVRFSQAIIRAIVPAILQLPGMMMPESAIAQIAQFIFLFGFLIAIFDQQKRTLYDHIAGTRVVQNR